MSSGVGTAARWGEVRCVALAVALALAAGCGEQGGDGGNLLAVASPTEVRPAARLHAEYLGLVGIDRLRRFQYGLTVEGTVAAIDDQGEDAGGLRVHLAVAEGGLALRFADGGAGLRSAAPAPGTTVTARCRVDGLADRTLFLRDCQARRTGSVWDRMAGAGASAPRPSGGLL